MRPSPLFLCLTLSFWFGIYAFRAYVPAAVWDLADALPLSLKPAFAIATHIIATLSVLVVMKLRRRALVPLAIGFATIFVARQILLTSDAISPWLALLGWILWLPFMAALADEVAAHDADTMIAPAFAAAIALQLGMQSAWHGLDLPMANGPFAMAAAAVLGLILCIAVVRSRPAALPRPHASLAWLLLGPALFLEMTFAGNAGRISQITGLALPTSIAILLVTMPIAVLVANRVTQLWLRITIVATGFIATFAIPGVQGWAALIILAVQIAIICALREAADRRSRMSGATATAVSILSFFVLIFAFYNSYELPALWILAFAPIAIAAALARRMAQSTERNALMPFVMAALLGLLYFVPPPKQPVHTDGDIATLSYNIHHGFNDAGVPGMQHTAHTIAQLNPDLVALQEIGRGWTLVGGSDLVAYLVWRFPDYRVVFAPTEGQLWGNAIMSRLPLLASYSAVFDAEPGVLHYGWTGAHVLTGTGPFFVYSVHLTADPAANGGNPRTPQVERILRAVDGGVPVIVAGDFNANADDHPMRLMASRLTDLGVVAGLGRSGTWPAGQPEVRIDYVFGRGFAVTGGTVPSTTASDHLPILLRLRLADTTATDGRSSNRSSP